jgi:hypothetical protein
MAVFKIYTDIEAAEKRLFCALRFATRMPFDKLRAERRCSFSAA